MSTYHKTTPKHCEDTKYHQAIESGVEGWQQLTDVSDELMSRAFSTPKASFLTSVWSPAFPSLKTAEVLLANCCFKRIYHLQLSSSLASQIKDSLCRNRGLSGGRFPLQLKWERLTNKEHSLLTACSEQTNFKICQFLIHNIWSKVAPCSTAAVFQPRHFKPLIYTVS